MGLRLLWLCLGMPIYGLTGSPYVTDVNVAKDQPVPFSHKHHVGELGIDCRYCHTSVEQSSFAGLPPTQTCMTCHSRIWTNASMLEPVRACYRDNKSISWTRVNALPDFVYFNHSIHVAKGVGCATCHGPMQEMPLTWAANTLQMSWCLGVIGSRRSMCGLRNMFLVRRTRRPRISWSWGGNWLRNIRFRV